MSDFIQKQVDLIGRIVHDRIMNGHGDFYIKMFKYTNDNLYLDQAPVTKYIKPNTIEYYYICSNQVTINVFNENTKMYNILSDEGMKLYNKAQHRYNNCEWNDVLSTYGIEYVKSGFWYADIDSCYYDENETTGYLKTYNNIIVVGYSDARKDWAITSEVIFLTSNWCLTRSMNLYKLITEINIDSNMRSKIKNKMKQSRF